MATTGGKPDPPLGPAVGVGSAGPLPSVDSAQDRVGSLQSAKSDRPIERVLFEEAHRFDFFQAVRLLERLYPHRRPVGRDARPSAEAVRFQSHVSLSFPPSAVRDIGRGDENGQALMTVAFMGVTGPLGVLPRHYTELIADRLRKKDRTLRDFLDLFNHRLVSLFYRAWEKHRVTIGYEGARTAQQTDDRFSGYVFDLFGMGTAGVRNRLGVPDRALLFYAGLLAQVRRSATTLEGLLQDYFGVPVTVVQFVGQWLRIAPHNRSRLGGRQHNNALGVSAVAGSRSWDQQAKLRIQVGPLTVAQYDELLPSGSAFQPLVQLTRYFIGQEFDFDVQLILRAAEVPRCRLGAKGIGGPRLGWSSWLKTEEFAHDAGDAVASGGSTRLGAFPA
jgi:type VI secretion system protein ImpH